MVAEMDKISKRSIITATVVSALILQPVLVRGQDLTGDVKLACEALLCLSSGVRPGECAASLARYFGISYRLMSDTIRARVNFLQLCPIDDNQDVAGLVEAIGYGAGFCDAEYLNMPNAQVSVRDCRQPGIYESTGCVRIERTVLGHAANDALGIPASVAWQDCNNEYDGTTWELTDDGYCMEKNIVVVPNVLPPYCMAYTRHSLTYGLGLQYSGNPLLGGKWILEK